MGKRKSAAPKRAPERAMGKRKSAAPKRAPRHIMEKPLTEFRCPFCNHDNSVTVHMQWLIQRGEASCQVCLRKVSAPFNPFSSDPFDVYSNSMTSVSASIAGR